MEKSRPEDKQNTHETKLAHLKIRTEKSRSNGQIQWKREVRILARQNLRAGIKASKEGDMAVADTLLIRKGYGNSR